VKVLVWVPFVNLGGGVRLLASLVEALARQPEIEHLRLATSAAFRMGALGSAASSGRVEHVHLPPSLLHRLLTVGGAAADLPVWSHLRGYLRRYLLPRQTAWLHARWLKRLSSDVDVVYVFWPHQEQFVPLPTPVVCTYQDTTFLDFPEILGSKTTAAEKANAIRWIDGSTRVVLSSAAALANLKRHCGSARDDFTIIYHNILPFVPSQSPSQNDLPPRYVVYPANTNVHKNHDMLLIAWSRFKYREQYALVLVGEGTQILAPDWDAARSSTYWQHDRLVGLAERLGLRRSNNLLALGYVSDAQVDAIVRNAAALIMPSLAEGGGSYPVEEALFFGVPVLCADIAVMREHFDKRSVEPIWFDPLSPDAIARALEQFVENEARYREEARSAMTDPRPTWDDVAAQYVQVFRSVIRPRSG
jgi:glycosyltransferase involved in cell wall biosynthesis